MIVNNKRGLAGTAATAAAMLLLSACDSVGSTRLAGISAPGDAFGSSGGGSGSGGSSSGGGDQGGSGGSGTGTGSGGTGTGTGGTGTGGTGTGTGTTTTGPLSNLPIGSITGSGGVAATGIASNVGTAGEPSPLAPVLTTAGNAALGLADVTGTVSGTIGNATGLSGVTGAVTQTVANAGTALNGAATGQTPLVDGVTGAVAPLTTVALGGTTLLGSGSASSLVAISAGSPATGSGSLVDLHLAKDTGLPAASNLLGATVGGTALASPSGTPLVDVAALGSTAPSASLLGVGVANNGQVVQLTALASSPLAPVTHVVDGLVSTVATPVTGGLMPGGATSQSPLGGLANTALPVVGSVLGGGALAAGGGVSAHGGLLVVPVSALGGSAGAAPITNAVGGVLTTLGHH